MDSKTRLFTTLFRVLERVPDRLAIRLASGIAGLLSLRESAARRTVETNVRAILSANAGDVPLDAALVRRLVRRNFQTYGRYWAEGATLAGVDRHNLASRMVIGEGEELLRSSLLLGKGVVLALPHVGSWEWGGAFLSHAGMPMTAVAERLEPEELFQFFVEKREAMGLGVIPLGPDAGSELMKHLKSGGLVGLLCDRDIAGGGQEATLFGQQVTVPKGPATLALRTGATLLVGVVYSRPDGQHLAVINGPIDTERRDGLRADVERVTNAVTLELERLITRAPDQWHVFQPIFSGPGPNPKADPQ